MRLIMPASFLLLFCCLYDIHVSMSQEKINDIEATIAHQEQQIQDLSDMVTRQWDEIEMLKARLNRTQDKLKNVEESANSATKSSDAMSVSEFAASEKPPHY